MHIIKLNAIPSTNAFLKDLITNQNIENYTVVITEHQTEGKGQRGNSWFSESGKNLTFSVLIKGFTIDSISPFLLNAVVAISLIEALETFNLKELKIKWPNDILSENKKIGGILIENKFHSQNKFDMIVGIGLNVNQTIFDLYPQASSMKLLTKENFDLDEVFNKIVQALKNNIDLLHHKEESYFWEKYHSYLFRKDIISEFIDKNGTRFLAVIKSVTRDGKLEVINEEQTSLFFDLKEVTLIY